MQTEYRSRYVHLVAIDGLATETGSDALGLIKDDDYLSDLLSKVKRCQKTLVKKIITDYYISLYGPVIAPDVKLHSNNDKDRSFNTVILVYDIQLYDLAQEIARKLKNDNTFIINVCISDTVLKNKNVINTNMDNVRNVILNLIRLALPVPGFISFGLSEFDSFLEDGYTYKAIVYEGKDLDDLSKQTLKGLSEIDNLSETMVFVNAKYKLLNTFNEAFRADWIYVLDSYKENTCFIICKTKEE